MLKRGDRRQRNRASTDFYQCAGGAGSKLSSLRFSLPFASSPLSLFLSVPPFLSPFCPSLFCLFTLCPPFLNPAGCLYGRAISSRAKASHSAVADQFKNRAPPTCGFGTFVPSAARVRKSRTAYSVCHRHRDKFLTEF